MTAQNLYSATPTGSEITGFIFTDLDSYRGEYDHRQALFGTEEYELQMIDGSQIDQELFTGLKINHAILLIWFNEIQHLTFDEKVGLWFLIHESGFTLTNALDAIQDGLAIFHGSQQGMAQVSELPFQEFHFAGETWIGASVIPSNAA